MARNSSIRRTKKYFKGPGARFVPHLKSRGRAGLAGALKETIRSIKASSKAKNAQTVYDSAGKDMGKFSRKAAKIVARVVGGSVGKPKKNPIPRGKALAFKTKAAANKWVKTHRVKGYRTSIKKATR